MMSEKFTCGICGAEVREASFVFEEGTCKYCVEDRRKAAHAECDREEDLRVE